MKFYSHSLVSVCFLPSLSRLLCVEVYEHVASHSLLLANTFKLPSHAWNETNAYVTTINIISITEGVGKSSLISTFVSRYFSEIVPGRMTRVRLPPDPSLSSCVTTIIDTQGGDSALIQSISSKFMLQQQQLRSATSINSLQALLEQSTESIAPQTGASLSPIPAAAAPSATVGLGETSDIPNTDKSTTSKDQAAILAPSAATLSGSTTSTTTSSSSNTAIENVDSIILVYDLDRVESFFRLENHWLPLIEKCYDGKVSTFRLSCNVYQTMMR